MKELAKREYKVTADGQKVYVFSKKEFENGVESWLYQRVGMPVFHHVGYDVETEGAYLSIFPHYEADSGEKLTRMVPYLPEGSTFEDEWQLGQLLMDLIQSRMQANLQEDYLLMDEVLTDAFGWGACAYELDENQVEVYVS